MPSRAQTGSTPGLAFHHDQLTNQYLEYSPSTADALLDEMGLSRRDGRGMRLRLDGSPFTINFEVSASTLWTPEVPSCSVMAVVTHPVA